MVPGRGSRGLFGFRHPAVTAWVVLCEISSMAVSISCPQLADAAIRSELARAVEDVIRRWRPSFENWRLSLFRSQSGCGWDLAISGPRFRKGFRLNGPADDLPGLVAAYMDALLAHDKPRIPNP